VSDELNRLWAEYDRVRGWHARVVAAARKAIVDEVERRAALPLRVALWEVAMNIACPPITEDRAYKAWQRAASLGIPADDARALLNQQGNDPEWTEWTEEDEWIAQHQQGNDRG
jgi:hypothetical protein